jgi:hypothetical protein
MIDIKICILRQTLNYLSAKSSEDSGQSANAGVDSNPIHGHHPLAVGFGQPRQGHPRA